MLVCWNFGSRETSVAVRPSRSRLDRHLGEVAVVDLLDRSVVLGADHQRIRRDERAARHRGIQRGQESKIAQDELSLAQVVTIVDVGRLDVLMPQPDRMQHLQPARDLREHGECRLFAFRHGDDFNLA